MKKCLLFLCAIAWPFIVQAQNAGSDLFLAGYTFVTVADNANGSMDPDAGLTLEAWVYLGSALPDQKIINKASTDFSNAYVFGVDDGLVKFEVFNDDGNQSILWTGDVPTNAWTHLVGTFEVGGMMRVYINGQLAGEETAGGGTFAYTTNDLVIGSASWNPGDFPVVGEIDEVRIFRGVVSQETINDWMFRDVTSDHPNYSNMGLYHKYNEGLGSNTVADETGNGNEGSLGGGTDSWSTSTVPFKGDFDLPGDAVSAVWEPRNDDVAGIMNINAVLSGTASVVFAGSDGGNGLNGSAPAPYASSLDTYWRVTTQGSPSGLMNFDLAGVDLGSNNEVVLLESSSPDFGSATVIEGTLVGSSSFNADVAFTNGNYYTLGVGMNTSTLEALQATNEFSISPNPNNGQFVLDWNLPETGQLIIYDYTGKEVYQQQMENMGQLEVDLQGHVAGLYIVQMRTASRIYSKRLTVK